MSLFVRAFLAAGAMAFTLATSCAGSQSNQTESHPPPAQTITPAPRLDLHCTPQSEDAEAMCRARGSEYTLRPRPVCHGTEPPPEIVEAERAAYDSASMPCECLSSSEVSARMACP